MLAVEARISNGGLSIEGEISMIRCHLFVCSPWTQEGRVNRVIMPNEKISLLSTGYVLSLEASALLVLFDAGDVSGLVAGALLRTTHVKKSFRRCREFGPSSHKIRCSQGQLRQQPDRANTSQGGFLMRGGGMGTWALDFEK